MRRALALWILACLVSGAAVAATRDDGSTAMLTVDGGWEDERVDVGRRTPTSAPTTTLPPATTETTAAAAPVATVPPTTTSTLPPLVTGTITIGEPGLYVVARDGSSARRVRATCDYEDWRVWFSPDVFVVQKSSGSAAWHWVDGRTAPWEPLPPATDRWGQPVELRGTGSPSPDGRRVVVGFPYGAAIVDLVTRAVAVVSRDDVFSATWLPNGLIVLSGAEGTAVLDSAGKVRRDWAASGVALDGAMWTPSPDGHRIVTPAPGDPNRWVLWDPVRNRAQEVPHLGVGWNSVGWAGSEHLVIGDPGIDHHVLPSVHLLDLATGAVRKVADAAVHPVVPTDGQVIAFFDRLDHQIVGLMDLSGTRRSAIVRAAAGLRVAADSWSPDGRHLLVHACTAPERTGGLPTT